jgi:predicted transcriptional regulator
MSTKEAAIEMIRELPAEASIEDIMHELYVQAKIEKGLKQVAEGKVVDHDEVKRRLSKWLD